MPSQTDRIIPVTIIGARYGLISTKNSGNRALRVRDEADMQRDMSATPEPRIVAEDGYDPVSLGGHQDRDWSDERQEFVTEMPDALLPESPVTLMVLVRSLVNVV
jgi:hypothetical protein